MLAEAELRLVWEERTLPIAAFEKDPSMLKFKRLLFIAFLSTGTILATQQTASNALQEDVVIVFAHLETIAIGVSGEGHHKPDIVVRMTNRSNKIDSFGVSNEAGVLIAPLPPGRYCYEAFDATGHHLKMKRPAAERCFEVEGGKDVEVGVEFMQ
jgi:hypothetical protein